tara:strand:+ start:947 stop:1627 length:681 start_codon:yes stop_codon:yes gene_type:complete
MYNLFLLLKNINNYGVFTVLKIIFYEAFYIIKFRDIDTLNYKDTESSSYKETKDKKIYDTPYIPTPYYFLKIAADNLKKNKINNFLLLDLGCGYSRSQKFFSADFKSLFLGVDIDGEIIDSLKKKRINKAHFLNLDLRNSKKNNQLLGKINELKKNRELVIFFSDSFDLFLLNKILKKISIKFNYYCIIVNLRNNNQLKINYMTLLNKKFKSQNRNIKILKINEKR